MKLINPEMYPGGTPILVQSETQKNLSYYGVVTHSTRRNVFIMLNTGTQTSVLKSSIVNCDCSICIGRGETTDTEGVKSTCISCDGTGKIIKAKARCKV